MKWNEITWAGSKWIEIEWNGMTLNGMRWHGIEWNEMRRNIIKWDEVRGAPFQNNRSTTTSTNFAKRWWSKNTQKHMQNKQKPISPKVRLHKKNTILDVHLCASRMTCNEIHRNDMKWNDMERHKTEWDGTKWNEIECGEILSRSYIISSFKSCQSSCVATSWCILKCLWRVKHVVKFRPRLGQSGMVG